MFQLFVPVVQSNFVSARFCYFLNNQSESLCVYNTDDYLKVAEWIRDQGGSITTTLVQLCSQINGEHYRYFTSGFAAKVPSVHTGY